MNFSSVPAYSFAKGRGQKERKAVPGPAKYKADWKRSSDKRSTPKLSFKRAKIKERSYPISKKQAEIYDQIIEREGSLDSRGRGYGHFTPYERRKINKLLRRKRSGKDLYSYDEFVPGDTYYNYKVGPGSYEIYDSTLSRKSSAVIPKSSMNSHSAMLKTKRTPGPGHYLGQGTAFRKNGVARQVYKTGRLSNENLKERRPGPGDYNYDYSSISRKGIAKLKPISRRRQRNSGPGPGDYNAYSSSSLDNGVPISSIGRDEAINKNPGPGHYNVYGKTRSKGIKIPRAMSIDEIERSPGPGEYNIDYSTFGKKSPTNKRRVRVKNNYRYSLNRRSVRNLKKKNIKGKGVVFNASRRWKDNKGFDIGPGSYDIKRSVPDVAKYLLPKI